MTNQHDFTDTMQPIIELMYSQMRMEQENEVMKAVQSVGVNVDKERLIQALTDAQKFYSEGYMACIKSHRWSWFTVQEMKPEVGATVLCYGEDGEMFVSDNWMDWEDGSVSFKKNGSGVWPKATHWQYLPMPPEVEV